MFPRTLLSFALVCLPVFASGTLVRDHHVAAELVSRSTSIEPGEPFVVGLRLVHDEAWHTYWKASTTGYPTSIEWELPDGFSAGELQWPVPVTYEMAGLVEFVYEGEVLLPIVITPPADLEPGAQVTLRATAEWLMCEQVCIPGKVDLTLELPVTAERPATDSRWESLFTSAYDQLPVEDLPHSATAWQEGDDIFLLVETTQTPVPEELYFFDARRYLRPTLTQSQRALDDRSVLLTFSVDPAGVGQSDRLEGVLVTRGGTWGQEGADRPGWALSLPWSDAPPIPAGYASAPEDSQSLATVISLAFVGGLILNLMPCVFPVIGIKIMGFVNQAGAARSKVVLHGLTFAAGVLVSFWALAGVLLILRGGGAQLGWGFQLQDPGFVFALTVVLFLFGLNMSGVFEIGTTTMGLGSGLTSRSGLAGSFFSGVLATVVATPCAAPFLAPALGAALALPAISSIIVFTFIGVGLATPYLMLSVFPQLVRKLPRPGPWMETFKEGLSFLLYASAGVLLWVLVGQLIESEGYTPFALLNVILSLVFIALAAWVYGRWGAPHRRKPVRRIGYLAAACLAGGAVWSGYPTPIMDVEWEIWEPGKAEQLAEEGHLVYVDFTARWCVTCQTNKATVFQSEKVKQYFENHEVVALKADWTNQDPEIARALRKFGRSAVPFNLVYHPGSDRPIILPELLTPAIVLNALEADPGE